MYRLYLGDSLKGFCWGGSPSQHVIVQRLWQRDSHPEWEEGKITPRQKENWIGAMWLDAISQQQVRGCLSQRRLRSDGQQLVYSPGVYLICG